MKSSNLVKFSQNIQNELSNIQKNVPKVSTSDRIQFIQFGALTDAEIMRLAVVRIDRPSSQGESSKDDLERTPYDRKMGPTRDREICETCGHTNRECPGHWGYIVLAVAVWNIVYMPLSCSLLKCLCPECARPRILPEQADILGISSLKGQSRFKAVLAQCSKAKHALCPWEDCGKALPHFEIPKGGKDVKKEIRISYKKGNKKGEKKDKKEEIEFTASEGYNVFVRVSNDTLDFLGFNSEVSGSEIYNFDSPVPSKEHIHHIRPEAFIFTVFPVMPPISRPFVEKDGQQCDDDLTEMYNQIIKTCKKIEDFDNKPKFEKSLKEERKDKTVVDRAKLVLELQNHIWDFINEKDTKGKNGNPRPKKSIYKRLVGKQSRLGGNIGGKRTDQSARSVIMSSGVRLRLNQLGVPEKFAKILTNREIAVPFNFDYLQRLVCSGLVNSVKRGGKIHNFSIFKDQGKGFKLRLGDIVERQLLNRDILVFNRQPSLRTESFVSFEAVIIPEDGFRLHPGMATGYNAD